NDTRDDHLKLFFVERGIQFPVPPDSIPYVALDSLIIPERYEKTLSPSKIIDFKEHYSILGGSAIDLTVSGSVSGCENRVYFFQPGTDSTYLVTSFIPGPWHYYFTGGIIPNPNKEYLQMYALFLDRDNDNSGVITLSFSNSDTTLSYDIDAAQHTVILDEKVCSFRLDHITKSPDLYLYMHYIDGASDSKLTTTDPFFVLFPIIPDSSGIITKFYKVINITPGSKAMGIHYREGKTTFS
ncbi:MAG: hypothetical protein GWN62_35770, partial [Aliifodinibius sp.]|nr:hypothetical protein [Nitrosopumilaceae archaeon]NIV16423.1 hypothetical protein [Fodinibius sp.]NIX60417.1 hypothetical protein [Nitrosopumilaceae archaeon]